MKKWFIYCFIFTLMIVTGCNKNEASLKEEQVIEPSHGQKVLTDITTEEKEKIAVLYKKAEEAFKWFYYSRMPMNENIVTIEGMPMNEVEYEEINTWDDLELYLSNLFDSSIVERLLMDAATSYKEFNGKLYTMAADRGSDITKGEEVHRVGKNQDDTFVFEVEVEILGGEEFNRVVGYQNYQFVLIENESSNLVFKNFDLIR